MGLWHKIVAHLPLEVVIKLVAELLVIGLASTVTWLIGRTKFGHGYREAEVHLKRGKALQEAERFVEAKEEIDRSIKILEDRKRNRLLSEAYLRLGDIDMNL